VTRKRWRYRWGVLYVGHFKYRFLHRYGHVCGVTVFGRTFLVMPLHRYAEAHPKPGYER